MRKSFGEVDLPTPVFAFCGLFSLSQSGDYVSEAGEVPLDGLVFLLGRQAPADFLVPDVWSTVHRRRERSAAA